MGKALFVCDLGKLVFKVPGTMPFWRFIYIFFWETPTSVSRGNDFSEIADLVYRPPGQDDWVRLPLGGFYNHSDTPNCYSLNKGWYKELYSKEDIKAGEELTSKYDLYNLTK